MACRLSLLALAVLSTFCGAGAAAAEPSTIPTSHRTEAFTLDSATATITADDLQRHAAALADDTFEGREAGSRGGRAAAGYLQMQFKAHGLAPAGDRGSYYQIFEGNCRNILGKVEGSDPELKDEVIVFGAHFDHVGYGNARNSYGPTGYIHNGADDNASGAATLVEVAEAYARLEPKPKRTVLFALWDAEERGLNGSKWWVAHPTVPLQKVRLMINMDMVGRLRNNRLEIIGARTARGLRRLVSLPNHDESLLLDFTWEIRADSDHHSFYARNIPILMAHTGMHGDYHRPSDDVEKLNVDGMRRVAVLLLGLVTEMANQPEMPRFREASRRESPWNQSSIERVEPAPPGRLGLSWDRDDTSASGLKVLRVEPGSPAARAGIKIGDRLLSFAGYDLAHDTNLGAIVVGAANPVAARLARAGQDEPLDVTVELRGKPTKVGILWREDDAEPRSIKLVGVVPHSPAARAGLRPLDRIYAINGQEFASGAEAKQLFDAAEMPYELTVESAGRVRTAILAAPEVAATK